jgi:hypothetical protein
MVSLITDYQAFLMTFNYNKIGEILGKSFLVSDGIYDILEIRNQSKILENGTKDQN